MKTILIVEDNADDMFLLKMACKRSGIVHDVRVATDGDAAIAYLSGKGPYANRSEHPFPHLVFLDINLPKLDGHSVLKWIRDENGFKTLPVVMLTASFLQSDIARAYELGVTSYLRKVASPAEFGQAVRVILKYWLEINLGPPEFPR